MKRSINLCQLLGFGITTLAGTILHFLYDWLGKSAWIAPFSGVNESTWEHMKLLFWPMLLFAIIERLFFKEIESFWCVKARGIILGLAIIPIIFYTYNGVIGKSPDWINITIFFVSAAIAYVYEAILFYRRSLECKNARLPITILVVIGAMFVIFTFVTPKIGIFQDPITKTYGI